jgi:hypothetical protein
MLGFGISISLRLTSYTFLTVISKSEEKFGREVIWSIVAKDSEYLPLQFLIFAYCLDEQLVRIYTPYRDLSMT